MQQDFEMLTGEPVTGAQLAELQFFLQAQELDYDPGITYTCILMRDGAIAATGSCSGNIIKCVAVDSQYRGQNLLGQILTQLVSHFVECGITHYFGFTKPKNREIFCQMGLYPVAQTEAVLLLENRKNGLERYLQQLQRESRAAMENGQANTDRREIGAVVANCDPFTLGHQYLMERAAESCRWLHIFVLAEHGQRYGCQERLEMVRQGTARCRNVVLHSASDYLISPAVFPTYFIKEKAKAFTLNCELDIELFGRQIAPALGITRRFIGSEPQCAVTAQYNQCLHRLLPGYHIAVTELPRLKQGDAIISASTVRTALQSGDWQTAAAFLPATTQAVIQKQRDAENGAF